MNNVFDLLAKVCEGKGAKFASFVYRTKGTNELQKVTVILGASTEKLYQKDVATLEGLLPELKGIELVAAMELLNSRLNSFQNGIGHNDAYTCEDVFQTVNANTMGVKIHKENGELHITGLMEHKTVLEAGVYKEVKSSEKTLAKNAIRAKLPSTRFRQYVFNNVVSAKLNGETLELEGSVTAKF
jgi:hypothetical protein